MGSLASHLGVVRLTSPPAPWQTTFQGPASEVSMPATQFGNVTTQEPSVRLFSCLKYKHPKQVSHRILPSPIPSCSFAPFPAPPVVPPTTRGEAGPGGRGGAGCLL